MSPAPDPSRPRIPPPEPEGGYLLDIDILVLRRCVECGQDFNQANPLSVRPAEPSDELNRLVPPICPPCWHMILQDTATDADKAALEECRGAAYLSHLQCACAAG